jgi:membrane-bound lytic murein transglycosylase D
MKKTGIICLFALMTFGCFAQKADSVANDTLVAEAKKEEISFVQDTAMMALALPQNLEYIPAEETPELLADRLSCIQQTVPLIYSEKVDAFINYFTIRDRDFTRMALRRKDIYFPIFERYLKKYDLPEELKYLSIIESGLNPKAVSRARAVGLWQFMSGTGKYFSLGHDWYNDDRMDPEKSTDAACRYLSQLYTMFNDWELALAAYNSGPGTVRRAIKRSGYKKTFAEIYDWLPRETRSYVPQYVAAIYAVRYAEEHNIFVIDREEMPVYDTIQVRKFLHFETFAKLTNTCLEDLQRLNPALLRNAVPDGKYFTLKIPVHSKEVLILQRKAILDSSSTVGRSELAILAQTSSGSTYGRELTTYRVVSGDGLGTIAGRYNVRLDDLRAWNSLPNTLIHPGQLLNIWILPSAKAASIAHPSAVIQAMPPDGKLYIVQPGDTLWDISKKFDGLTVERIKTLNNLKNNKLQPGQKLIVG